MKEGAQKIVNRLALAAASFMIGTSSPAGASTLLNLIDAPGQSNTPFALAFTASGPTTQISIAGYQVPWFEQTTQNGVFLNGIGPNLLGSTWVFTASRSGSVSNTFSDGTSVPALNFGGVTVVSYDTYTQTSATTVGSLYTLDFLYSNGPANAPSGLLVTTDGTPVVTAVPEPSTWARIILGFAGSWRTAAGRALRSRPDQIQIANTETAFGRSFCFR
jgi:hypothetical protein